MKNSPIIIYTDGSCNPQYKIGAWAAILFVGNEKIVLSGTEQETTHQRMELTAVIKAFEYLAQENREEQSIRVFTDSQYVVGSQRRSAKLEATSFIAKGGMPIHNADLLRLLMDGIAKWKPDFVKVKAHQREVIQNGNQEVDKLARKILRGTIEKHSANE